MNREPPFALLLFFLCPTLAAASTTAVPPPKVEPAATSHWHPPAPSGQEAIARTDALSVAILTALGLAAEEEVIIEAPEYSGEGGKYTASGGVVVTQGPIRLTADTVTYDKNTGEVVAEGNVVYTDPERTVRGQRVLYDTETRRVQASEAETVIQGVIVRAGEIDADPSRYTVLRATITTCDLPRPHYRLTAREVIVTPNDRIVARRVGVWLFGTRLFVVPRIAARIGEGRGEDRESPFPRVGSNSRDSLYVQKVFPLIEQPQLYLDLDARISLRRAFTGGFNAAAPAGRGMQWIGQLKYRDDAPNQRSRFLEIDRLPEVGILWVSPDPSPRSVVPTPSADGADGSSKSKSRSKSRSNRTLTPTLTLTRPLSGPPVVRTQPDFRPLRQVGSDVAHQPGLLEPPRPGRWYLRAQSTIGYFHQREDDAEDAEVQSHSGARLDFRASASRSGLRIGGVSLPVFQLFLRRSFYDSGDSYTVWGIAARRDWRWGPHWSSGLRAFWHKTNGQTPYAFDRVEIRTELQPTLAYTAGGTTWSWTGRLDVDRWQFFDQEFAIARVLHCIEPRISYRTRRRQFGLDLQIVGLDFD